jgi:putative ABC transport system substrate-binding protein
MKRRDFLTRVLLTVTATSTQAQQKAKVYRLAVVNPIDPVSDISESGPPYYRAFFEQLRKLGFVEERNLEVKRYSGEGHSERFDEMVAVTINLRPDVIVVTSTRLLFTFKQATTTIPLVGVMGQFVLVLLQACRARVAISQG